MKNILKFICFIIGLIIILISLSYIFYPKSMVKSEKNYNNPIFRTEAIIKEEKNTIDTLYIGSSLIYTSVSPMHIYKDYGFTSYNLGTDSQTLDEGYSFFKKTLKKQNLKLLVIETNTIFNKRTISYDIDNYLKDKLAIFKYHQNWSSLDTYKTIFNEISSIERQYMKGYYLIGDIVPAENKNYVVKTEEIEEISKANIKTLNNIIKLANKNNVKIMFLSVPSIKTWDYKKHNAISKFSNNKDIEYLDMNLIPEIGIDWTKDTKDQGDHLNYYGATKVSDYLGKYLSNINILDNHRNDKKFKTWDEDLILYEEYVKNFE